MYIKKDQIEKRIGFSWRKRFWFFLKNRKINIFFGTIFLFFMSMFSANFIFQKAKEVSEISPAEIVIPKKISKIKKENVEELPKPKYDYVYAPVDFSMEDIKNKGCVVDGILSGYGGDTNSAVAMINRSSCLYLHRALETWADTPDFKKATEIMEKIKKSGIIYGMFISEAIKRGNRSFEKDGKKFDFSDMCQDNSKNIWGEHTCKASMNDREYREYLEDMTHEAMDIGIQGFLFGQIYLQDNSDPKKEKLLKVLDDMRSYAKKKGMKIVIGAQTGTITEERYLRMFDYIEGGVGMGEDGKIENGPCWSQKESCWALLWNDRYATKANNILLHLDWSGLKYDDMSVYARMDKNKRTETLEYLYDYFTSHNMGFLMPMMATLNKENGGCYGPKKGFYSASKKYSCQDELVVNSILSESK